MKEQFRKNLRLSEQNKRRLIQINKIIENYKSQGYRLTLRQLYYQLVSKDLIPNKVQEYAKLSGLLVKGRMAGQVDWDSIEDRLRRPKIPYYVEDIPDAINDTISQYRLNRMAGQKNYIEVWCEKDALSNVLYRVTKKYHVRLMVNRGYSSCTAMHDAYKRFVSADYDVDEGNVYILYLGDHDPSGLDMIRDISSRQDEFGVFPKIVHIAITRNQIKQYNPPPNPAKISDPRAKWYIKKHGQTSWEVDALDPSVLHSLLISAIEKLIDKNIFNDVLKKEKEDKDKLREFMEDFDEED